MTTPSPRWNAHARQVACRFMSGAVLLSSCFVAPELLAAEGSADDVPGSGAPLETSAREEASPDAPPETASAPVETESEPATPPAAAEPEPATPTAGTASSPAGETEPGAEQSASEKETEPREIALGVRGFGGVLVEGETAAAAGGVGLLASFGVHPHIEIEGSVALVFADQEPGFVVVEGIAKWVLLRERTWSPHVSLGPLLSVDFAQPAEVSVGGIAGGGLTYWLSPRVGVVFDLNFRLLVGAELGYAGTLAGGVVLRPF